MKKISLQLLVLLVTFASLPSLTNAQNNVDMEKKWSRVTIDRNSTNTNLDYKYIPGATRIQNL